MMGVGCVIQYLCCSVLQCVEVKSQVMRILPVPPPSFQGSCNENGADDTSFQEPPPQANYCKCALEVSGEEGSSPNLAGNKFEETVYVDNWAIVPHSVRSLADGRRMLWGG